MRMSADKWDLLYEAFLCYSPLLLVTSMVGLWALNLWVFARAGVDYRGIFALDENHLTHREISGCAKWMTCIVVMNMIVYLSLHALGKVSFAAPLPVLLYVAAVTVLVIWFDIFYLPSRLYFLRTLGRIVLPVQAISFSDSFLADILTSMAKAFSDLARSVCRMLNGQVATIACLEDDSVCGSHFVVIVVAPVLPYFFRFFQCLRQGISTWETTAFLNASKYFIAAVAIGLSDYRVFPDEMTNYRIWLFVSVANSFFTFCWDVFNDWGLWPLNVHKDAIESLNRGFTRIFNFNEPHWLSDMLYRRRWVYYWLIGSNFILRFTWTYKLFARLHHNYLIAFVVAALEIIRRCQWIFFRVEYEWNKNAPIPAPVDTPNEEEPTSALVDTADEEE